MKALVIIPARGGSKGIPKKNIALLKGKPLIHYTIEVARSIFEDDDICVSTDSEEIKNIAEQTGLKVPFIRPAELAEDTSGTYEVLLHAVDFYANKGRQYDVLVLLQPTSPLRSIQDVKNAIALYSSDIDMVVSVKETSANPYYLLFEEKENGFLEHSKRGNFTRRQDCPKVWEYNGAVYVINIETLKKKPVSKFDRVKKSVMDEVRSIDIDTPLDWTIVEAILSTNH